MVNCVRLDGTTKAFRIQKLFGYYGYSRVEIDHAEAGDIVAIAGLADISVGETICEQGKVLPLPVLHIDEPTLQMTFGANTSPFVGRDGKLVTARKIEERLLKETQKDVSLKVETATNDSFLVSGRGELHLGILIENMRREGFELQVSKPKVIIKEIDGVKYEPWEDLQIEIPALPAPLITTLISSIFLPTTFKALIKPAHTTIAVPCWSSWNTGISNSIFKRASTSKQRGADISSRFIPPKVGAICLQNLMIS